MCVRWVFPRRRFQDRRAEFALFAVIGSTGLGLTELILWTGSECLGLGVGPAKLAALVAVAVWNFVLRKMLLFSHKVGSNASARFRDISTQLSN